MGGTDQGQRSDRAVIRSSETDHHPPIRAEINRNIDRTCAVFANYAKASPCSAVDHSAAVTPVAERTLCPLGNVAAVLEEVVDGHDFCVSLGPPTARSHGHAFRPQRGARIRASAVTQQLKFPVAAEMRMPGSVPVFVEKLGLIRSRTRVVKRHQGLVDCLPLAPIGALRRQVFHV
jgi:hypothetical protein